MSDTKELRFLSVNTESNDEYTGSKNISAVVRVDCKTVDTFTGRVTAYGCADNASVFESSVALEEAFFKFYAKYHNDEFLTLGYFCFPNETDLFTRCIQRDVTNRHYLSPFPLHELGTLLFYKEESPLGLYEYVVKYGIEDPYNGDSSHPLYYSMLAAIVFEHLMLGTS